MAATALDFRANGFIGPGGFPLSVIIPGVIPLLAGSVVISGIDFSVDGRWVSVPEASSNWTLISEANNT